MLGYSAVSTVLSSFPLYQYKSFDHTLDIRLLTHVNLSQTRLVPPL